MQDEKFKSLSEDANLSEEFAKFAAKQNPYFYIKIANLYLNQSKELKTAIGWLDKATAADTIELAAAYYYRGFTRIALHGNNQDHVDKAVADFKKSKTIIEQHLIPSLHVIQQASSDTDLYQNKCATN